jgi:hypothetical protein
MTKSARLPDSSNAARIARLGLLAIATQLATPALAQWGAPGPAPHPSYAPKLVVFDAPGATTENIPLCSGYCGTQALAMNDEGTIVGSYIDPNVVPHGFIRTPDGRVISFDTPNAGIGPNLFQGTVPYTINDFGVVAGQYEDANNVYHGFIRYPDNRYEVVNAPAADQTPNSGHGTLIYSNNIAGENAGIYFDVKGQQHSFFSSAQGVITTIDPPGALYAGVCEETCLSPDGTAVGAYFGSSTTFVGFLRTRDGKITTFSAPNAGTAAYIGTFVASISVEGDIAGYVIDNNGLAHGFVRHRDGTFVPDFEIPQPTPNSGTAPFSINAFGATTGIYIDGNSVYHGFERTAPGLVSTFNAPATVAGTGPGQGTRPSVNNFEGQVAGWTIDATGVLHGFVWTP